MSNKKTKVPAHEKVEESKVTEAVEPAINVPAEPEKVEESKVTEAVEPTINVPAEPEITETNPEEDMEIKKIGVVKDCGSLNIRSSADIKSESLGTIPVGEEVEIVDECPDSDFYEVVYGSLSGFSMKKFISLVAAEE